MTTDLGFPGLTPPSMNRVGSRGAAMAFHRQKRQWQKWIEHALMASDMPRGCASVTAHAVLRFPVSRRRDEDNYRSLLSKATGDALVNGGWLADDTPDQYRFMAVEFTRGPSATLLTLDWKVREAVVA